MEQETIEPMIVLEASVRFGKSWYKLVGASILIGVSTAVGVYLTGRTMFKDAFDSITVTRKED